MTVLILTDEHDLSADRMVIELGRRGIAVFRADLAWFPQRLTLEAEFRDGQWQGCLACPERAVDLTEITGAWYRSPTTFQFPDGLSATERQHSHNEAKLGLGGVLMALPITWVNPPARVADAAYRPVQMAAAAASGLTVPNTAITNSPGAVRRFSDSHRAVVTKMLGAPAILESGGRRIAFTERLTPDHLSDLRGIQTTAHQFQAWVDKQRECRVTVVGETVFAVAIDAHSPAARVDWRVDYGALTYERIEPPTGVNSGIVALMRRLDLVYGALDFVVTPDNEWVFLEINAGGQFGWLEDATGIPVTATLAEILTEGNQR
ncbi:MAG: ATP-grasp ribosomal peptide maturase [Pseudonocardiaceae bacterium]